MTNGTLIHGFQLLHKIFIKEADSTAYTFEHVKSGARVFILQNADDNKVFPSRSARRRPMIRACAYRRAFDALRFRASIR